MRTLPLLCGVAALLALPGTSSARDLPWNKDGSAPATAAPAQMAPDGANVPVASQQGLLNRVAAYLNSLTTIESDFVQLAPDGSLATGKFFLKRPGKMRWQYDPPVPVLMVSNGKFLVYYDYELEQVSNIPLDETLAGFLAQPTITFDPKVIKVLHAQAENGVIRIRIALKDSPEDGELTMEMTDSPLQLRNLLLKDKEGKETNVSLSNAKYGQPLKEDLFIFKDPRSNKHPSRR